MRVSICGRGSVALRATFRWVTVVGMALAAPPGIAVPATAQDEADLAVVHRIKAEAFRNSQVMDLLFRLTDENGPRLTGSPGLRRAADWSARALRGWDLKEARLERWGTFGRGWSCSRYRAALVEPDRAPLIGVPKAWSGGTDGAVAAAVISAPLFTSMETKREDDYDLATLSARIQTYIQEQKGKLRGAIVMLDPTREFDPPTEPAARRYDVSALEEIARAPEPFPAPVFEWPLTRLPEDPKKRAQLFASIPDEVGEDYFVRWIRAHGPLYAFLRDEGVVAVLETDLRGEGGVVFAQEAGSWERGTPTPPPVISLQPESYARLARLIEKKVPVRVELDVAVTFHDDAPEGFNVVAEIPGGRKKDEVVMLGAHLDSWHGGTGATDDAAGCAIALEAVRILKALDLKMDRTVRIALWSGEEQGLFGSRGYVRTHFGNPVSMELKPEHARLSGYFNVDNGGGKIRGVYLQGNDMMRPIADAWLLPFHDLGATAISIDSTGDTDHVSFDGVGLPGFQFIQDPLDYDSRTHHSNLDVSDHVVPGDLMQASAILASFVYHAAVRPDLLPRKPLPMPTPKMKDSFPY